MPPVFFSSGLLVAALLLAEIPGNSTATAPSTTQAAAPKLKQVTYAIADLVVPTDDHFFPEEGEKIQDSAADQQLTVAKDAKKTSEDQLMKLITATIAPASWSANGGPGELQYHSVGMGLVVQQTEEVQEQIANLLAKLRRLQELEVAVEVRLVEVSDGGVFERIGVDFNSAPPRQSGQAAPAGTLTPDLNIPVYDAVARNLDLYSTTDVSGERRQAKSHTFLDDRQVIQLLDTCQGDVRTNVMQLPKVTTFNGQRAAVEGTEQKYFLSGLTFDTEKNAFIAQNQLVNIGWKFAVRPTVSADRNSVHLSLFAHMTTVDENVPLVPVQVAVPQQSRGHAGTQQPPTLQVFLQNPTIRKLAVKEALDIPDGKTVVLDCGATLAETRKEYAPTPILSKIPYVNRLCKNVGYGREAKRLYLLVTPRIITRIIINEEEEQIFLGNLPPLPRP